MKKHLFIYMFVFAFGLLGAVGQNTELQLAERSKQCKLVTPNAFTPNGDGVNDTYFMHLDGACGVHSFSIKIFDQWGRLLFESDTIETVWDGTYDGQPVDEGVYLWQVAIEYLEDYNDLPKSESKNGTLILIR